VPLAIILSAVICIGLYQRLKAISETNSDSD